MRNTSDQIQHGGDGATQSRLSPATVHNTHHLNNLAPDIVESILDGTEPDGILIAKITEHPISEDWNEQRRLYDFPVR